MAIGKIQIKYSVTAPLALSATRILDTELPNATCSSDGCAGFEIFQDFFLDPTQEGVPATYIELLREDLSLKEDPMRPTI